MRMFAVLVTCLLFVFPCQARIITVDDDGPADFNNIQAAIDDSNNGDIIQVQPGIYTGGGNRDIDYKGKIIIVRSIDPNDPNVVAATIIDCNGTEAEPHRGFYFHNNEDNDTVLNGFTIKKGWAEGGGGIYCYYSSPLITNNIITQNVSRYDLFIEGGGGISCYYSSPTIINNTITNNLSNWGGGIDCYQSFPIISNNLISNNSVTYYAGGGGICSRSGSWPIIKNNLILSNNAAFGAGICCCSDATITGCVIKNNYGWGGSNQGGGGIDCYGSSPLITNNIILDNRHTNGWGGGIRVAYSSPTIVNNTIIGNTAREGGGVWNTNDFGSELPEITNCIIRANIPEDINTYSGQPSPRITYCNISGTILGEGNIDVDPCFADPNNGDYHLKSEAGRWNPNIESWVQDDVTSLCIDAGDPKSPIGLEPFPNGGRINMGAYGGTAYASKSYFGGPVCEIIVAGDINGDCVVDFKDFAIMAFHWLEGT